MYIEMSGRSSKRSSKPSYTYSSPKSPTLIVSNHMIQQPGFFSNMLQGFALGTGQSIAMNIFRSEPQVTHIHETIQSSNSTVSSTNSESIYSKEYTQCMKESNNDKEACKEYLD
jgi:hypothetical protein